MMRKDSHLLEIGGNIGTQTVYFALSGAYSRIVSIEPDPRNFPLLQLNIRQNHLEATSDRRQLRRRRARARSTSS
jgi:FkbM family methyltransferase